MRKVVIVSSFFILSTFLINHGGTTRDEKLLIHANNEFASKFYKVLAENTDGNFIFSPMSLSTSLALLSVGAEGETLEEIQRLMGFPLNESTLIQGYTGLSQNQVKANKVFNGLFLTNNLTRIESRFDTIIKNNFHTTPRFLNSIPTNHQLEKEIEGIIKNDSETDDKQTDSITKKRRGIVPTRTIPRRRRKQEGNIILANYMKFKAGWETRFEVSSTASEPFYVSNDEILTIPMMRQIGHFHIIRIPELNSRAISIPYLLCDGFNLFKKSSAQSTKTLRSKPTTKKRVCKSGVRDSRLQMIILLPNEQGGLAHLEGNLTAQSLLKIPPKFEYKSYLDLSVPKFNLHSSQDLINMTEMFGMKSMSSSSSNFNRISQSESLKLSKIFHHVSIQVDEKGSRTKASHLKGKNPWTHPKLVKIDQPFIAFIHDKKLDAILIVLRIIRPIL